MTSIGHYHHSHGRAQVFGRAFAIATLANVAFVVVEFIAGWVAGSVALIADATHNLGDVAGLALAWVAGALARRRPTARRTYGFGKATVLAGVANACLLIFAAGGVAWEAVERLADPPAVAAMPVIVVAAIGVVVNAGAAALFVRGRDDVNVRGAFVHLVADAAVSVAVVVAGIGLALTGWHWLDPLTSLLVTAAILYTAWALLRDAGNLALDAVPPQIDARGVQAYLRSIRGVADVHDLHIWPMSANETAMTAHLVMDDGGDRARVLHDVGEDMRTRFGICHCTIQIEPHEAAADDHRVCGSAQHVHIDESPEENSDSPSAPEVVKTGV